MNNIALLHPNSSFGPVSYRTIDRKIKANSYGFFLRKLVFNSPHDTLLKLSAMIFYMNKCGLIALIIGLKLRGWKGETIKIKKMLEDLKMNNDDSIYDSTLIEVMSIYGGVKYDLVILDEINGEVNNPLNFNINEKTIIIVRTGNKSCGHFELVLQFKLSANTFHYEPQGCTNNSDTGIQLIKEIDRLSKNFVNPIQTQSNQNSRDNSGSTTDEFELAKVLSISEKINKRDEDGTFDLKAQLKSRSELRINNDFQLANTLAISEQEYIDRETKKGHKYIKQSNTKQEPRQTNCKVNRNEDLEFAETLAVYDQLYADKITRDIMRDYEYAKTLANQNNIQ